MAADTGGGIQGEPVGRQESGWLFVERQEDVLHVTLNRPDKRNALSRGLLADLKQAFQEHSTDETLKAAVLSGAGDRSFAAGGDLRELESLQSEEGAKELSLESRSALDEIRSFPVPVIAALNGDAFGGGAELAVSCDFRVAAAHAHIGFLQGRLAISTAWGGGIDLLRLLGSAQGLRLLCSGDILESRQALQVGLFDSLAEDGIQLEEAVNAFLAPMLRMQPQVLRAFKALAAAERRGEPHETLCATETHNFVKTWVHPDHWIAAEKALKPRKT